MESQHNEAERRWDEPPLQPDLFIEEIGLALVEQLVQSR